MQKMFFLIGFMVFSDINAMEQNNTKYEEQKQALDMFETSINNFGIRINQLNEKIEKNNKIQENSIALLHQKNTTLEERINVLNSTVTNHFNQQNELKKNYNAIELLLKQQGEKQDNQILIKTNHLQAQIDKLIQTVDWFCTKSQRSVSNMFA